MDRSQDIVVTYRSGAYNTNRVQGASASSTSSAAFAATRLAEKLFGDKLQRLEQVSTDGISRTTWRAHYTGLLVSSSQPKPQEGR